jgi:hypothetical protein
MSLNVIPVKGAAMYSALLNADDNKACVYMVADGFSSVVQKCATPEAAFKAADRWQKKENKAVLKATK